MQGLIRLSTTSFSPVLENANNLLEHILPFRHAQVLQLSLLLLSVSRGGEEAVADPYLV